jgi:hypothetical protein
MKIKIGTKELPCRGNPGHWWSIWDGAAMVVRGFTAGPAENATREAKRCLERLERVRSGGRLVATTWHEPGHGKAFW